MAEHRAEQIIVAVIGKLTTPPLATSGANVYREDAGEPEVAEQNAPGLRVYQGADEPITNMSDVLIDSMLDVRIQAFAQKTPTAAAGTLLNRMRKEVTIALQADPTLGLSFVHDIYPTGTAAPSYDADAAKPAAAVDMLFRVIYRHRRVDPST